MGHPKVRRVMEQKYFDYPYTLSSKVQLFPYNFMWRKMGVLPYIIGAVLFSTFTVVRGYEKFTHSPRLVAKYLKREETKHFRHFEVPELPKGYVEPPKHY